MKNLNLTLFLCCLIATAFSQPASLEAFHNLTNKTWKAEGNWGDGTSFKQEVSFEYALEGKILLSKSKGYTNQEQSKYGMRNYGVRKLDTETGKIKFWEFDVFGGLTEGEVLVKDKNIYYQYPYGEAVITDMWEYVDESTYNFKIGSYKDGKWEQVYLNTQFKAVGLNDLPDFKKALEGSWSSKAWDGILNETWSLGGDGHIQQSSQYLENGEVLYEASSKIEVIAGELILISVIKDSNPKIFKATSFSENHITFENSEYKNPNVVRYEFVSDKMYKRTISGMEKGEPTSYTFVFEKKE